MAGCRTSRNILFISGHDYRSKRQANIHFIARELSKYNKVRFFSIGYSWFSKITKEPRLSLWKEANKVVLHHGVECFLWRSALHPIRLRNRAMQWVEALAFSLYARAAPALLHDWIRWADTIIVESGMGVLFFDQIKALNPDARVMYRCSDSLDTIGCADVLKKTLASTANVYDAILLPSKVLADDFPPDANLYFVPHGIDVGVLQDNQPSPYGLGTHLVSVGSMLFDVAFFEMAAKAFPEVKFHIIGGGRDSFGLARSNVIVYDEMPFAMTIPYIRHADAGIAPYRDEGDLSYLADTSMKLLQFGYFGLPAVCPEEVVGAHSGRFGYRPGDAPSIIEAIGAALAQGRFAGISPMSWTEVAERALDPRSFSDTKIDV